ncbi:MAG: hypothetical protein IPK55_11780 [Streptococcus sp.]|nr:hypothetical protein [Streptococcus sp.]
MKRISMRFLHFLKMTQKPLINLSWLVKASEALWENPTSQNDHLTKLERHFKINEEVFVKTAALLI